MKIKKCTCKNCECKDCKCYTMKSDCGCGCKTRTAHPPKFSEKFGKYRRAARK